MAVVLIVDDNRDLVDTLALLLAGDGHDVRSADNGLDGLNAIEERRPDLVLLDVEMPLLDGPGMAHRLSAADVGRELIPIVLLSGARDLRTIAKRVGTPYFLAKPYEFDDFVEVFNAALTERIQPAPEPRYEAPMHAP